VPERPTAHSVASERESGIEWDDVPAWPPPAVGSAGISVPHRSPSQSQIAAVASGPPSAACYVVVQRGAARLEVVPLVPNLRMTIGRAPSNRIVVLDAKCSRQHCELVLRDGEWVLRDLDSRNGVTVDGIRVDGEWPLELGQTIGIGGCTLVFTDRPSSEGLTPSAAPSAPFAVIERKSGTRYDAPALPRRHSSARGGHDVAALFRLVQEMSAASDEAALAASTIEGLLAQTSAQIGTVLLLPDDAGETSADRLAVRATAGSSGGDPPRGSRYLSEMVLTDREAVLVHDISQHQELARRPSLDALDAGSAICAPIRHNDDVLGVIHLYGTRPAEPLDADQLEFALAVADQMAGRLALLRLRARLEQDISRIEQTNAELRDQLEAETDLIGDSETLQRVRRAILRVAPTDATVLIRGESGVGKELVARAVHFNSDRRDGPFVCVNCAALTESLLESELFGHEKGAFTGAIAQKPGKFEQAHGGTLFLDEIGEMAPDLQAKFLRVLEGQSFERVGGGKPIEVDIRFVTATNRNLEQAVKDGRFRNDLYFRLQVIEVSVPPLREHPQDVELIAQHFVQRFARKSRVRVRGFDRDALTVLQQYSWPGNVRELRNVVERAVILADREMLSPDDITLSRLPLLDVPVLAPRPEVVNERPTEPGAAGGLRSAVPETKGETDAAVLLASLLKDAVTIDELDRRYMLAALEHCQWNKSQAARMLGIERTTLDRRLKRYGVSRGDEQ